MNIILPAVLIIGGMLSIFYLRPKMQNKTMEMKFMQTKSIAELLEMFDNMDNMDLGEDYRQYVELKGNVCSQAPVMTPYSEREVAYCESGLTQVTEVKEQYRDNEGCLKTRVTKRDSPISNEKTSQVIRMKDSTDAGEIVLEIQASGCELDIPKTFDRFEPKNNMSRYGYFSSRSYGRFGADTLGFKMTEKTIELNQKLYVIGEAFLSGGEIHIGKPKDSKKPFIVSTKSEEELINSSDRNALFSLVGGIAAAAAGVALIIYLNI